jgi:hypothetical protein
MMARPTAFTPGPVSWMHTGESGVGVGNIDDVPGERELVERPRCEYNAARERPQPVAFAAI